MTHNIQWIDGGREPQCPANPEFPMGRDIDTSKPDEKTCKVDLPYPARRCGLYLVHCDVCNIRVGITTAGRVDDPKSVVIVCRRVM